MKPYLLALSLLVAGPSAYAQPAAPLPLALPVDPDTHQITYSGIIAVPGVTKSQLYARGMIWFITPFYLHQHIIQADDQQAEFIVGKVFSYKNTNFLLRPSGKKFWCTIRLSFQEGRYRYILTDFQFDGEYGGLNQPRYSAEQLCFAKRKDGTPVKWAAQFSQDFDQQVQQLVSSIESGLAAGSSAR